jgi:hypothetical protein
VVVNAAGDGVTCPPPGLQGAWVVNVIYVNDQPVWYAGMPSHSYTLKPNDVVRYVATMGDTHVPGEVTADLRDGGAVATAALSTVPCRCGPEYYERGLVAPGCDHHDLADEMAQWSRCGCAGCQRLAAAESEPPAVWLLGMGQLWRMDQ